jgi:N-methylhydantoinase B
MAVREVGSVELDRITTEVIGANLLATAEEMGIVLIKAAYSTNIKERADCSAALLGAEGTVIAQAEHIPMHLGSMLLLVPAIRERYPDGSINPGDVFITNDPYAGGGTHLNDVTVATPFFWDGKLIAFASDIAHHSDIGGSKGQPADIYGEGLRIPPIKLVSEGVMREDVMEFILANWRLEEERHGDIRAQLAALRVAGERLEGLCSRYSGAAVIEASRRQTDQAERQARAAISQLPGGTFEFTDYLDDDGMTDDELPIHVAVTVEDGVLTCDFTGTSGQVRGNVNCVWSALAATVYYAVKAVIDPSLPANGGYYRAVRIVAPTGTLVNCVPPAAVGFRTDTCQRVVDVLFGALAKAVPDRVVAACHSTVTTMTFFGNDSQTRRFFVYPEVIGGGFGGRPGSDGPDAVQVHITNTSNLPVESLEAEYPLLVERYELVPDSGGPGRYRGGLGILRQYRVLTDDAYFGSKGDRRKRSPWGLAGGLNGAPSVLRLNPDRPDERVLPTKNFSVPLKRGDVIRICTPGGGGYGPPSARERAAVERDLVQGKISRDAAVRSYGWTLENAASRDCEPKP